MDISDFDGIEDFHEKVGVLQRLCGDSCPAQARRRVREPPAIKALRASLRSSSDPAWTLRLRTSIWNARKHWLATLHAIRQRADFQRGRPTARSKKLSPLKVISINGQPSMDHQLWAQAVGTVFKEKWKDGKPQRLELIRNTLASSAGLAPVTSPEDFLAALPRFHKPHRLDSHGISPLGVRVFFHAYPQASTSLFSKLLGKDEFFSGVEISGHVAAKKRGHITAQQTRAIVPFPTSLALLDIVAANMLESCVDSFANLVDHSYLEAARKRRQILDLTFCAALHIEKSLDCHGLGCVAQADVKQYFDNLCPIKMHQWITAHLQRPDLGALLLRLHTLPSLRLSVGSSSCEIRARTSGFFTGTRPAGVAARIPLLDVPLALQGSWPTRASIYNDVCCAVGSYVDNLVSLAPSHQAAVGILEDFGAELTSRWQLTYGDDSREFLPARGYPEDELERNPAPGWKCCDTMRCLGHWLSSDGSIGVDCRNTIAAMWKCFYANLNGGLTTSSRTTKLNFLDRCVRPLASWKWARWPHQRTLATKLDQAQTHMIGILCPVHPRPQEAPLDYFRRRSLLNGRVATKAGRWSQAWARAIVGWQGHFTRDHANCKWAPAMSAWHDSEWLEARRGRYRARTRTRATRGKPSVRWQDGFDAAKVALSQ